MQSSELLPEPIKDLHRSLEPFVKQGQEVAHIRRVLALHLSSHVNPGDGLSISLPLALLSGSNTGSASSGVRGARREYLRCLRANTKAREAYQKIREDQQTAESQRLEHDTLNKDQETPATSLNLFLDVVKFRRKHERLRIVQDYLDMLAQKPAAASNHLDPQMVLKNMDSPPSVPSDVMVGTGSRPESQRTDLNELVEQLERSVLRAKLLLKREQKLLAQVRSGGQSPSKVQSGGRLQALGMARNELINWIETELAKAGDRGDEDGNGQSPQLTGIKGKDCIDSQLSSIRRQYLKYAKARQALIIATTGPSDVPPPVSAEDDPSVLETKDEIEMSNTMSHVLQPYLEELTSVSSQQKSMIQQKSFLTISLAKQLKEASQGLDRLADESHLLPAYPLRGEAKGLKSSPSFGEEISSHEKPDSSHRARAWVHASEASSKATHEAVADKLEDGEAAMLDARQIFLDLYALLGEDPSAGGETMSKDMWATLDGHLGAIARDDIE